MSVVEIPKNRSIRVETEKPAVEQALRVHPVFAREDYPGVVDTEKAAQHLYDSWSALAAIADDAFSPIDELYEASLASQTQLRDLADKTSMLQSVVPDIVPILKQGAPAQSEDVEQLLERSLPDLQVRRSFFTHLPEWYFRQEMASLQRDLDRVRSGANTTINLSIAIDPTGGPIQVSLDDSHADVTVSAEDRRSKEYHKQATLMRIGREYYDRLGKENKAFEVLHTWTAAFSEAGVQVSDADLASPQELPRGSDIAYTQNQIARNFLLVADVSLLDRARRLHETSKQVYEVVEHTIPEADRALFCELHVIDSDERPAVKTALRRMYEHFLDDGANIAIGTTVPALFEVTHELRQTLSSGSGRLRSFVHNLLVKSVDCAVGKLADPESALEANGANVARQLREVSDPWRRASNLAGDSSRLGPVRSAILFLQDGFWRYEHEPRSSIKGGLTHACNLLRPALPKD